MGALNRQVDACLHELLRLEPDGRAQWRRPKSVLPTRLSQAETEASRLAWKGSRVSQESGLSEARSAYGLELHSALNS